MHENDFYVLQNFVNENNRIEGLNHTRIRDLEAHKTLLSLEEISITDLETFVSTIDRDAHLRRKLDENIVIQTWEEDSMGVIRSIIKYRPPPGGPYIEERLKSILENKGRLSAWAQHIQYEKLHPFTDVNGRSGRALWLWRMGFKKAGIGFLHKFYYQTLQGTR